MSVCFNSYRAELRSKLITGQPSRRVILRHQEREICAQDVKGKPTSRPQLPNNKLTTNEELNLKRELRPFSTSEAASFCLRIDNWKFKCKKSSLCSVADHYGCTARKVTNRLKHWGVQVRRPEGQELKASYYLSAAIKMPSLMMQQVRERWQVEGFEEKQVWYFWLS